MNTDRSRSTGKRENMEWKRKEPGGFDTRVVIEHNIRNNIFHLIA